MPCPKRAGPALALWTLFLPPGGFQGEEGRFGPPQGLALAEAPATEDDLTSSSLLFLLRSAALLGK